MIVDSSAILAVPGREPDAERCQTAILAAAPCRMPVAGVPETSTAVESRDGAAAGAELDAFPGRAGIEPAPVTRKQPEAAREAWRRLRSGGLRAPEPPRECRASGKDTGPAVPGGGSGSRDAGWSVDLAPRGPVPRAHGRRGIRFPGSGLRSVNDRGRRCRSFWAAPTSSFSGPEVERGSAGVPGGCAGVHDELAIASPAPGDPGSPALRVAGLALMGDTAVGARLPGERENDAARRRTPARKARRKELPGR